MYICFLAGFYPIETVPYAAFIETICRQFVLFGCKVVVIAPQSVTKSLFRRKKLLPYHNKQLIEGSGCVEIFRPYSITFGEGILRGNLTLLMNRLSVEATIIRHKLKPDIFYAHFWTSAYNVLFYASRHKIPLFVATGEDRIIITRYLSQKTFSLFNKFVKGVICVSTKNVQESVNLKLVDEKKCILLPNSVDLSLFRRLNKDNIRAQMGYNRDDFIVIYVGRFVHRKGSRRVSDALSMLATASIKSIFIGGNIEDEKNDFAPSCPGILFSGTVSHNCLFKYLNCADVFVLPTLAEGCSNSIVEAMACGLPIISSDLDFNYDILDSSNAILINPLDVTQIADAILHLRNDVKLREKMGESSYQKARNLSLSNRVHRIMEFIKKSERG